MSGDVIAQAPLVRHFDLIAQAPGGVARLRELILTLAVQGKLVPQDPSDEPASELLKKIRVEKDRLIAEGKIKRDKPLAEISDKEKPFDLPGGWEWVRFSALAAFENGDRGSNYPSRSNFVDQGIAFINAGHLVDELIDYADMNYITPQNFDLLRSGKIQRGDILYCLRGSLGKFAQVTNDVAGAIASSLVIIRLTDKAIASYVMRYLKSSLAAKLIKRFDNGTAQPNLGAGDLAKFVVPLPPLAEQSRIVTRVAELMQLCDALEAKGIGASRRSQVAEWVCAKLATAFGLPIADYALADVPQALIDAKVRADIRDLGAGLSFASCQLPHAQEFSVSMSDRVFDDLAMDVLVFDWWVRNDDRKLTNLGGNPNLLWDVRADELKVIDHNLAFDRDFKPDDFLAGHVFRDHWNRVFGDLDLRQHYLARIEDCLQQLKGVRASIPDSWWWLDEGVPADVTWDEIEVVLLRARQPQFWDCQ